MLNTLASSDEYTCYSVHVTQLYTGTTADGGNTAGTSAKLNTAMGWRSGKIGLQRTC